jgi:hypothetical protein
MATTDTHARIKELFEAVFSVPFVLRLYKEDQLPLPLRLCTLQYIQKKVLAKLIAYFSLIN